MRDSSKLPDSDSITTKTNHKNDMPRLDMKVLIVGSCFLSGAISMFAKAGCTAATSIEDADLVCFLGGEDVDPSLYGEKPLRGTYFNRARDDREIKIFEQAQQLGVPSFGICRGMQLLHVLNGGKLYQHVHNHACGQDHEIVDVATGEKIVASSMHHQMCIENDTTFALAISKGHSGEYHSFDSVLATDRYEDLEAAIWPAINAIGVQGHPEVAGNPEYTEWCLSKVREFVEELKLMGHNGNRIDPQVIGPKILG